MNSPYIKLGVAALLPVILTVVLYNFKNIFNKNKKTMIISQIIIGILFGALAVLGTEWSIPMNGANVNARDAAPLCAGLFFGPWAGIIAGVIGGVERWIAVAWGIGTYTRLACSLATALAGFYAAFLRKFMFSDRKPSWSLSLAIGVVMEVIHLTLVIVTNFDTVDKAISVVKVCTVPMLAANGISVMLASLVWALLSKDKISLKIDKHRISDIIQRWLLLTVVIAFVLTTGFMYLLQKNLSDTDTKNNLSYGVEDIKEAIYDAADVNILSAAESVAYIINSGEEYSIDKLCILYELTEINVVNSKGIITDSTNEDNIGFDMSSGEQSSVFNSLLRSKYSYVQEYGPIARNESIKRKYAGYKTNSGYVQVGYNLEQYQASLASTVEIAASNRRIGNGGFILIYDTYGSLTGCGDNVDAQEISMGNVYYKASGEDYCNVFQLDTKVNSYYAYTDVCEDYLILGMYPVSEADSNIQMSIYTNTFLEILVFALLFGLVYLLIKHVVVDQIQTVNESLAEITGGNLNVQVQVRESEEFASLSDDINQTVDTLKHYIDEAAARIDKELEFAKNIQYSALPNIFPAFPHRTEFDVYARMDTAKEVGGDFYDFYLNHHSVFNFLIADVSGKGIPAALFMMRAKTQLKSLTESNLEINDVFTKGNAGLCEGNDANMFVTAWQGRMNLETGLLEFANAGHNQPLVKHKDGKFEYLKTRPGFVLAGMDGVKFKKQELQLGPGDIVFLYTDGVTEATDAHNELYGEDRLQTILNSREFSDMKDLCDTVKADVDKFVGDAPQFDDITMLGFKYNGEPPKATFHRDEASTNDIAAVTEFVEAELEKLDCPMRDVMQIDIAIDELYSNIAYYSYPKQKGPATVVVQEAFEPHGVRITFIDEGIPYNPLKKEDPDTTLALEERGVGGLGIFMVKKSMDEMIYEYKNDQNILTILKYF